MDSVLGRVCNIVPLSWLLNRCRSPPQRIPPRAQALMSFAGLRGAIAFALALTFPEPSRQTVISATIVTVLSSTLVLGGLTAPLVKWLGIGGGGGGGGGSGGGGGGSGGGQ